MSVLKNLRNLSRMQFYKNAIEIRKEITNWMLKDFGTTKNKKYSYIIIESDEEEGKDKK